MGSLKVNLCGIEIDNPVIITLEELSSITGYDVKTKIMKMKKWLKSNVE